ncbi:MAG: HTH-type transcriptional activator IlvY [Desulfuromonadaceae bacterium]
MLHFGRASQACNLSPSALTRTIQRLEDAVGQPLFDRDNRTTSLTAAGEQFRGYARQALLDWQGFKTTLKDGQAIGGTLSIYASITAVYSILPDLLEAFRRAYPDVQLELRTGAAEQAIPQVLAGDIDLAVAAKPDRQRVRVEFLPITTTPLIFIAPKNQDLPIRRTATGQLDLSRTPLVLPQIGLSRRRLDQWLKEQRIAPNITSEVSGNEAIIAMVRLGCGVGMVPQLVLERSPFREEVALLPHSPPLKPYVVGLCSTRRNLQRPGVKAFWTLVAEQSSR